MEEGREDELHSDGPVIEVVAEAIGDDDEQQQEEVPVAAPDVAEVGSSESESSGIDDLAD